jgi:molybdopterin-guanine dinucleotide biosynthesis protein A
MMPTKIKYPCTGVILSGGLATRYDGTDKALLRVGGVRILDRIYRIYSELFEEIILVTNSPEKFLEWDLCRPFFYVEPVCVYLGLRHTFSQKGNS